ncbi:MAG: alpha/beta hydrolase, partial [Bacteroidota bacterium]
SEEAQALQSRLLKAREDHQIYIYKTVKGYQLEAHIFYPDNFDQKNTYPALAAFHGGGWQAGNASWTFESAQQAAQKGMIGVAVEYRLSNRAELTPKEAMEDSRDLIKWLRAKAQSLRIDPNKIVGKGLSAGGHLISAISVLQEEGNQTVPNALVLVSPAIDTSDGYFKSLLGKGKDPKKLSALENLKADLKIPPTLILQGRTDRVTPTSFAQAYKAKMDSLGYICQLTIYEGCGHIFTPVHLDDTGTPMPDPKIMQEAFAEQDKFLRKLGFIK